MLKPEDFSKSERKWRIRKEKYKINTKKIINE